MLLSATLSDQLPPESRYGGGELAGCGPSAQLSFAVAFNDFVPGLAG